MPLSTDDPVISYGERSRSSEKEREREEREERERASPWESDQRLTPLPFANDPALPEREKQKERTALRFTDPQ